MLRKMRRLMVLLLLVGIVQLSAYQHEVAACAIFQNEAPYLKEWIDHHRSIGITHFYLYNHLSEDDWKEVLQPYVDEGVVDVIDWGRKTFCIRSWTVIQCAAYKDAIQKSKRTAKWLAVIDIDEFIVPKKHPDLPTYLAQFHHEGAVCINWQQFGTSWIDSIPPGEPITHHLTLKAEATFPRHRLVKSIVRPKKVRSCNSPHYFHLHSASHQVDSNGNHFKGSKTPIPHTDAIQINHYYTRDTHYFMNKKIPRTINMYNDPNFFTPESIETLLNDTNVVEDQCILNLVGRAPQP